MGLSCNHKHRHINEDEWESYLRGSEQEYKHFHFHPRSVSVCDTVMLRSFYTFLPLDASPFFNDIILHSIFFLHTFFHFKITRVETATKCYLSQLMESNTFETEINIIDFILFFAAKKNLTNAINRKITSQRIRFPLKLSYL